MFRFRFSLLFSFEERLSSQVWRILVILFRTMKFWRFLIWIFWIENSCKFHEIVNLLQKMTIEWHRSKYFEMFEIRWLFRSLGCGVYFSRYWRHAPTHSLAHTLALAYSTCQFWRSIAPKTFCWPPLPSLVRRIPDWSLPLTRCLEKIEKSSGRS